MEISNKLKEFIRKNQDEIDKDLFSVVKKAYVELNCLDFCDFMKILLKIDEIDKT